MQIQTTLCPICKRTTLVLSMLQEKLPYCGEVIIFSSVCKACGFKHNDVFNVEMKDPVECKFKVDKEEDLMVRVVRSSSGTVIVPELGVKIEPGPQCQGSITNVEGILRNIENVLEGQSKILKGKKLEKVKSLLKKLKKMIDGKIKFTLIIKDPLGNSAIISEKTVKRKLRKEEIKRLKVGYLIFNLEKHSS